MTRPPEARPEDTIEVPTGGFPLEVELSPGVGAKVALHRAAGGPFCWAYQTRGLAASGQAELLLLLKIGLDQDVNAVPAAPLHFFGQVAALAAQGHTVEAGGQTELRGQVLGGNGFVYAPAPPLEGLDLPGGALLALRACRDELEVFRAYGLARLLASWGAAARHYPFPPWCDAGRPAVVSLTSFQGTILDSVPRMPLLAWARRQDDGGVLLEIPDSQRGRLAAIGQLPPGAGFALLTHIGEQARGFHVWRTGQREPAAITPPGGQGERLGGAFVLFVPEQVQDEVRQHEDGFAIFLTPASEVALRRALEQGQPLALRSGFSLEWLPSTYVNPASGATLNMPSGMRTYQPEKPAPRGGAVRVKQTVLLTGEAELRARVTTEDLGDYLEQLIACAEATLGRGAGRGGFEVMVDLKLDPGHPAQIGLMTRGPGVDEGACNDLHRRASALHPPPVRGGRVALQVFFSVD